MLWVLTTSFFSFFISFFLFFFFFEKSERYQHILVKKIALSEAMVENIPYSSFMSTSITSDEY